MPLARFLTENTTRRDGDCQQNRNCPTFQGESNRDLPLQHKYKNVINKNNHQDEESKERSRTERESCQHMPVAGMYRADGWEPPDRRHLPARQNKSGSVVEPLLLLIRLEFQPQVPFFVTDSAIKIGIDQTATEWICSDRSGTRIVIFLYIDSKMLKE